MGFGWWIDRPSSANATVIGIEIDIRIGETMSQSIYRINSDAGAARDIRMQGDRESLGPSIDT